VLWTQHTIIDGAKKRGTVMNRQLNPLEFFPPNARASWHCALCPIG
jgi:hypothetical protein